MRFDPKTKKEIQEERLIPEGNYSFQISGAEDYISKAGNEMIKLTVRVFKPDGNFILVDDYLTDKMMFKILHICETVGLTKEYNSGELKPDMFIGKEGMLKLGIQKDKSGQYPDRNNIKDYLSDEKANIPKDELEKTLSKDDDLEDEIPF